MKRELLNNVFNCIEYIDREYGTRNPYKIAKIENIILSPTKLPACTLGISFVHGDTKFILVNSKLSETGRHFTSLHEIYHLINNHNSSNNTLFLLTNCRVKNTEIEKEADLFAFLCMFDYETDELLKISPDYWEVKLDEFRRKYLII
ncbi:ImmA/IrrE family metallo-endopeptidase [Anaerocellum danielii]|uniref:ImmA/IrrE family metallo-endopeptidase n=1 Tax=Anaerocellum danielii TaxID=1387557 RepID=A0ABZ0TXP8_9FIRM|nr:ImmA/IrrE family metallo-endopeptidase [Caldicellulosiruptor danielii]WPX08228.1 ImmA/IrrE family metallo-endopeptidase [Caldicellulosiruptor danielii]